MQPTRRAAFLALLALLAALLVACGGSATASGHPNYVALRQQLLTPLGGLIVATREHSSTQAWQRQQFDAAAEDVLARLTDDPSPTATVLSKAIARIRAAALADDLDALERERLVLLTVR